MDPVRVGRRDLGAEHAAGIRIGLRAAHLHDALSLHRDGQAARVGTIERTDAGALCDHGCLLSSRAIARNDFSYRTVAARSQPFVAHATTRCGTRPSNNSAAPWKWLSENSKTWPTPALPTRLSRRGDDSGEQLAQARPPPLLAGSHAAAAARGEAKGLERVSPEQLRPQAPEERGVVKEIDPDEAIAHEDGGAEDSRRRGQPALGGLEVRAHVRLFVDGLEARGGRRSRRRAGIAVHLGPHAPLVGAAQHLGTEPGAAKLPLLSKSRRLSFQRRASTQ